MRRKRAAPCQFQNEGKQEAKFTLDEGHPAQQFHRNPEAALSSAGNHPLPCCPDCCFQNSSTVEAELQSAQLRAPADALAERREVPRDLVFVEAQRQRAQLGAFADAIAQR
eukprot:CAMPEP_0204266606 /NCGR_PEP_ID=MMETSP0468-20130131/10428_1 /ASSEMBLY_ACC=CAM_ASM_000383 /TAXON_ID=2969 /ORGANISM="Oxyrrhis marina" /LENGTH=110 /DNA_ID=CAMNT_0051241689 /DNA_START=59 /DNA_END=392 /DNA_ORIENTATION=-